MQSYQAQFILFSMLLTAALGEIGQIGYFEEKCPQNWEKVSSLEGKFIIIAGNGIEVGSQGGNKAISLNKNHIPSHSHRLFSPHSSANTGNYAKIKHHVREGGILNANFEYHIQGTSASPNEYQSESVGNGSPFQILPPYKAMIACKKISESRQIMKMGKNIEALKDSLLKGWLERKYLVANEKITNQQYQLLEIKFGQLKNSLQGLINEIKPNQKQESQQNSLQSEQNQKQNQTLTALVDKQIQKIGISIKAMQTVQNWIILILGLFCIGLISWISIMWRQKPLLGQRMPPPPRKSEILVEEVAGAEEKED